MSPDLKDSLKCLLSHPQRLPDLTILPPAMCRTRENSAELCLLYPPSDGASGVRSTPMASLLNPQVF